jgi:hypothetical protein
MPTRSINDTYYAVVKILAAATVLSATTKLVLAVLEDHRNRATGQCNPRVTTIAEELGIGEATVKRSLGMLKHAGLISVKRGRSNSYEVAARQEWPGKLATVKPRCRRPAQMSFDLEDSCPIPADHSEQVQNTDQSDPLDGIKVIRSMGSNCDFQEPPILTELPQLNYPNEPLPPPDVIPLRQSAAGAPAVVSQKAENNTNTGTAPGADVAEGLARELTLTHPQPGLPRRAVAEVRKAMAAGWTADALRERHAEWCRYWATLAEGKFIPMLWRWLDSGDFEVVPVIRKPAVKETYADRITRMIREA